jgi:hypothetical protein
MTRTAPALPSALGHAGGDGFRRGPPTAVTGQYGWGSAVRPRAAAAGGVGAAAVGGGLAGGGPTGEGGGRGWGAMGRRGKPAPSYLSCARTRCENFAEKMQDHAGCSCPPGIGLRSPPSLAAQLHAPGHRGLRQHPQSANHWQPFPVGRSRLLGCIGSATRPRPGLAWRPAGPCACTACSAALPPQGA